MGIFHKLRRATIVLRKIPGGLVLGEMIRRYFSDRERIERVDDFDRDLVLYADLSEHMQSQIFWYGVYSADIIPVLKRILTLGSVVIDCGANIGEISLIAAKQVGPKGRVFSFEPIDSLATRLEHHAQDNGFENITVLRSGVARECGRADVYVGTGRFGDGSHNDGLGTIFPTVARSRPVQTIELVSIDDFVRDAGLNRVDLIKIDIEGGELYALQGAYHVLRMFRPKLIVEVGADNCLAAGYEMSDLYEFIVDLGYSMYRIGRRGSLKLIESHDLREFQNVYCAPPHALVD